MNRSTALVIGLPGVGKSTILHALKQRVPSLKQFSVRLFTLKLLDDLNSLLGQYLRDNDIVKPRQYMPDCIVEQIFAEFLKTIAPDDFLILEGYPVNIEQFHGMSRQLLRSGRTLEKVFVLEDDIDQINIRRQKRKICPSCELKNLAGLPIRADSQTCPYCGGELVRRPEDDASFFNERCAVFYEELSFICANVSADKICHINVGTSDATEIIRKWRYEDDE